MALAKMNPVETVYAVNGSGGAYVSIPCTIHCRKMKITECPPGAYTGTFTAQGLNLERIEDAYVAVIPVIPGESHVIGNDLAESVGAGNLIGYPAQKDVYGNTIAATIPVKVRSATGTATAVKVLEYS